MTFRSDLRQQGQMWQLAISWWAFCWSWRPVRHLTGYTKAKWWSKIIKHDEGDLSHTLSEDLTLMEHRTEWGMAWEVGVSGCWSCTRDKLCRVIEPSSPLVPPQSRSCNPPTRDPQTISSNHDFNLISSRLHLLLFRTQNVQVWHGKGRRG